MDKLNLSQINRDILQYWDQISAFEKSLELSKEKPKYVFYDGPPFATGTPHYGHLLASTIKDIVARYKTQTGYYVERVWGWDCHGLPIEYEIEKQLGIKTKQQIIDYTIPKYNEQCQKIVLKYATEWENTIKTLGRWIDYKNNWKTMDKNYMESVWWVFAQLYRKNLIYRGVKVMPYSTGCHTPLSNFEAQSNYKDVEDYSLTIRVKLTDQAIKLLNSETCGNSPIYLLVWTTTPWTLPSNLAICLSPKLQYILIQAFDHYYILAQVCVNRYFKEDEIKSTLALRQETLQGLMYEPLYTYYTNRYNNAYTLVFDDYVSTEKGTGCVHLAPAFGQDDYRVCLEKKIININNSLPCPIDSDGCFTDPVELYKGEYIKNAESKIVKDLNQKGHVFSVCKEKHSYPYCWRSETPLIQMAIPTWFMKVTKLTERLVELNKTINWNPEAIGRNRFGNWLESAQDWCISRNRYWGTPIPIWTNYDFSETVCVSSIEQLEQLAQLPKGTITDLHTHSIDKITIPSDFFIYGGDPLRRIPEVFDCWFESGCMPYAHIHYPFANNNAQPSHLPANFPADFIAEGLDQTRGWFYTLHVLSTALFDRPAFKNVIVNGLILAEDGKKMAKKLKNYPDPQKIFDIYGADVLRLYLISTDVVQGEPMRFNEKDLKKLIQTFFITYHNSISFLIEMIRYYSQVNQTSFVPFNDFKDIELDQLDKLMIMYTNHLILKIHHDMNKYQLNHICGHLLTFIDRVSRMYIKLKKSDIKQMTKDSFVPLNVLYQSLYCLTLMASPFLPFITEYYYQKIFKSDSQSLHFINLPNQLTDMFKIDMGIIDENLMQGSTHFMTLLDMGRAIRDKLPFSYKRPLKSLKIITNNEKTHQLIKIYNDYFLAELNALNIEYDTDDTIYIDWSVSLNFKQVAQLGHKDIIKSLSEYIKTNQKQVSQNILESATIKFKEIEFPCECFILEKIPKLTLQETSNMNICGEFIMIANIEFNEEIEYLYELRQLTRSLNDYRKRKGLTITDYAKSHYYVIKNSNKFMQFFDKLKIDIYPKTKIELNQSEQDFQNGETIEIYEAQIKIKLITF